MDPTYSSRPHPRRNDQRQPSQTLRNSSNLRDAVPENVGRPQYANFARPFIQQSTKTAASDRLRPPVTPGVKRGSVTSIYSQASSGDRPGSLSGAPGTRKHSSHLQVVSNSDLASVDEEDVLATPKFYDASSVPLSRSSSEVEGSLVAITPRPRTPEQDEKPLVSPITRSNSQWSRSAVSPEQPTRYVSTYRTDAVTALSTAITTDMQTSTTPYSHSLKASNVTRMPFEDSSDSNSARTETKSAHSFGERSQVANVPPNEQHTTAGFLDPTRRSLSATRSPSTQSMNPLLESPIEQTTSSMSDKIPPHRRPAQLNLKAVREAESRGSLTSLPDLIRRATRLASNLDRGKTASRLGLDMMFANGSDRSSVKKRESTYSDVLFSFPAPGSSRPASAAQDHRSGLRPGEDKGIARANSRLMEIADEDRDDYDEDEKEIVNHSKKKGGQRSHRGTRNKRRCCGMSLTVFVVLLVLVIILVAAAIVLPIVLIWLPKQKGTTDNTFDCARTLPCQNDGISIIDNNVCSCICVDGFTGSQCSVSRDPSCVTTTLRDGEARYSNATVGSDILSLLTNVSPNFSVSLNSTVILSMFAQSNFSCSAENSLVRFSASAGQAKRFIIVSETTPVKLPEFAVAIAIEGSESADKTINVARAVADEPPPAETSNDIVFQVSSTRETGSTSIPTPSSAIEPTSTSSTGMAMATSSPTGKLTSQQIYFAQVVVLYVLQEIRLPNIAVNSQKILDQYLNAGGPGSGNHTIDVVPKDIAHKRLIANFEQFSITISNGSELSGTASTN